MNRENMNYFMQHRTRVAGLCSSLFVIASFVLFFIDFAGFSSGNEVNTFLIGLLCLALSLFFAIIGLVKGNKESLGHTLCFPSIVFSLITLIIFCILAFTEAENNRKDKKEAEDGPHRIDKILSSDYLYQFEGYWGDNTKNTDFEPASTLFALCEAYGLFSDRNYKPETALLMALLEGFMFTAEDEDNPCAIYIVNQYFQGLNEDTYAIISKDIGKTEVIEKNNNYIVDNDAYKVMDESCKYYGSSYKGRLEAAKTLLNCSYKLPILVEESSVLIFFPIKSSLLDDCCWINLNSISNIEKVDNKSKITFKNGQEIVFDISKLSLENQIYRSTMLESIIFKRINIKKRD